MNLKTYLTSQQLVSLLQLEPEKLIPTIVQDTSTQQVLMLAYTSAESLQATLAVGEAVFYSRSRQSLWHKGLTSGHRMRVISIAVDCDEDTLLFMVIPTGPACHTGEISCFYRFYQLENENGFRSES
jgi:phosphoribosyl-AMP cyclohydrolase